MNKALIYTRVSTEEQATSDRHSLKTQLSLCEKAIDDGGEYKLAPDGIYNDPGKSATNMKRPGLQDMLLRIQEDKTIRAVFVQEPWPRTPAKGQYKITYGPDQRTISTCRDQFHS